MGAASPFPSAQVFFFFAFFPFKDYAALAAVRHVGSLGKSAERERERERERGGRGEPETRDHGGTSRTGRPT